MDRFKILHTYRKLARRGAVPPPSCACGGDLISRLGKDDEPRLQCLRCGSWTEPGERFMMDLESKIDEYERNRIK